VRDAHRRILAPTLASFLALSGGAAAAAEPDCEQFDLTGLPEAPTTFLEQQVRALVADHRPGDERDAVAIQRKLARAYRERGDLERAAVAERRSADRAAAPAVAAIPAVATPGPTQTPSPAPAAIVPDAVAAGPRPEARPGETAAFHGRFYGMIAGTLHTWDFSPDGTFLHTTVVSGAGTSVRNGERGRFRVDGEAIVLTVESTASAFVTPAIGGRSYQLGGSDESSQDVRRVTFARLGPDASEGILLGGARLKPKSW
jgi:hypothetical protein